MDLLLDLRRHGPHLVELIVIIDFLLKIDERHFDLFERFAHGGVGDPHEPVLLHQRHDLFVQGFAFRVALVRALLFPPFVLDFQPFQGSFEILDARKIAGAELFVQTVAFQQLFYLSGLGSIPKAALHALRPLLFFLGVQTFKRALSAV